MEKAPRTLEEVEFEMGCLLGSVGVVVLAGRPSLVVKVPPREEEEESGEGEAASSKR